MSPTSAPQNTAMSGTLMKFSDAMETLTHYSESLRKILGKDTKKQEAGKAGSF